MTKQSQSILNLQPNQKIPQSLEQAPEKTPRARHDFLFIPMHSLWLKLPQMGLSHRCVAMISAMLVTIAITHAALANERSATERSTATERSIATDYSHRLSDRPRDIYANAQGVSVDKMLATDRTVLGMPFAYPPGEAQITTAVATILPGQETGWHRHNVPVVGYILEGEMTVDYGAAGMKKFHVGQSFVEAFQTRHNGRNLGTVPVRILTVYAGSDHGANSVVEGE